MTALPPIAGMTPRLVTTLHGSPSRVMQSFTRAPWEGTYFEARVEADAPLDMRITRCDSKGNALDFAVLKGAGHGSSITAEYDQGKVYIWLWWNIDSTTGATMTPVRWAYDGAPAGTTVLLADTETLSLPAGVIPGHFAIDQAADRIATYSRSGNTETLKLFRFTDFKTGTATALKTATVTKPNLSSFQGFTTSDVSAYISRGGSAPTDVAPIIYEVGWDAGGVVGSKDVSTLVLSGGVAPGGHNEAEGVCLWRDQSGNPTLLFGIVTGPAQQREGRIYAFAAPVDGTKTKTVQIDAERVIDGPATNVVAAFSYDRTVRYATGGFTPTGYADPVKLSEQSTAVLNVSDHPDLTDDSYGFVIHAKLSWDDPADPGRRKTATYTAQLSAADPAVVNLSQKLVATGAVAPGQVIAGAPGHSPVVTMVGDQIAVDGVTTGPHLTADATAAQQAAAQSAQAAAASSALVGAPAGDAIDAHLGGTSTTVVPDVTALKAQVVDLAAHVAPNSGTDVTSAVQTFVDTLSDGDELLIGKGTWRIDGTLSFAQNDLTVHLRQGSVIDRSSATTATDCALVFTGARVTLQGHGSILSPEVWDGTNTTWSNAVVKFTGDSPTVRNITLTNVPKYGIGFFDTNGLATVDGVTVIGNYPSSQWTEVETGHQNIRFDPGVTDSRIKVTGCTIDSGVQGWCGGNRGAGSSSGSIITGNVFTRCWNHGIYNSGGLTDMVVQGNTFRDCSRPIVMIDSGHNVSNNTLTASSTGSTLFWTAAISMRNAVDCVVADNIIQGDAFAGSAAINLAHVSGGTTCSGNQITGNRIKVTTANQGQCISVGTTASMVMARNTIQGNIVEGPGVVSSGIIYVAAASSPTDATGNVVLGNTITILAASSGINAINLSRPKILSNTIMLGCDLATAATLGGVTLDGNLTSATVRDNTITVPATYGSNVTFRAIWERGGATVANSMISDNQIDLNTTKLTSSTPYVLAGGSPVLKASGTGAPVFICGPGSQWLRTDGGAGSTLYVKESASNQNTWTAK